MSKIKLDKNQQKQTDILAHRIMPKSDFLKVMEHDQLYWNTLNEQFEFNVIKADILGKDCQQIINNQTKELITKNIDKLTEWSNTKVLVLDLKGKLKIQEKLIEDKKVHYENVFLPQFQKEAKEAKENWSKIEKQANELLKKEEEGFEGILHKILFELTWWSKVEKKNQNNEEFIVQIYKPIKRLLGA